MLFNMLFQLNYPKKEQLQTLINEQKDKPLSYPFTSAPSVKIEDKTPKGYRYDNNCILIGHGKAVFQIASEAIRQWQMFPGGWAMIHSRTTPLEVGQVVVMCAKVWGLWWLNCSRIVFTVNEPNRFGFAYGTLAHHAESGEELFQVRMDEAGQVFYEIQAFSKPRYWMARLAFPVARYHQRKFVKHSFENMKKCVHENLSSQPV
jgi:uncharacterized protein (UPF0548 family)